jgi:hypothetical protein
MAVQGVRAEIDLTEVEKLAAMQASDQEMAAFFGVTTRTIERRRHEPEFAEAIERGKAKGRLSIRRAQLRLLEAGNTAIAIFLGKNYLNQTDRVTEVSVPSLVELTGKQIAELFRDLKSEQMREFLAEMKVQLDTRIKQHPAALLGPAEGDQQA